MGFNRIFEGFCGISSVRLSYLHNRKTQSDTHHPIE
jgi:hypothetical protein